MARRLLQRWFMGHLRSDERGAVMITGLFMAFVLIGALWFVIGIGDAIVFRERMQEAADHGAFTSAALHAKGMNFISAMNIVMLAIVVVHLVLGIIHDISLAACIISVGGACGAWMGARKAYTGYAKTMKPVMKTLHVLEEAAAIGYPWVGFAKAWQNGAKYGNQNRVADVDVFTLSASMVPKGANGTARIGLPVASHPMKEVCDKAAQLAVDHVVDLWKQDPSKGMSDFDKAVDWSKDQLHKIHIGGGGGPSPDKVIEKFKEIIQGAPALRYCNDLGADQLIGALRGTLADGNDHLAKENEKNAKDEDHPKPPVPGIAGLDKLPLDGIDPGFDDFWKADGPLYVDDDATNGSFLMQVWSLNLRPRLKDASEKKVRIAARKWNADDVEDGPFGYFAQSELFFDCGSTWGDADCNGEGADHHASYSLHWRARLRHVLLPDLAHLIAGQMWAMVTHSESYDALKKFITDDNPLYRRMAKGPFDAVAVEELKKTVDDFVSSLEDDAREVLSDGTPVTPNGVHH